MKSLDALALLMVPSGLIACNPTGTTQINQGFYPGVALSLQKSTLTVSTSTVSSGATAAVTLQLKDTNGNPFISSADGNQTVAFSFIGSGTSGGTFGAITYSENGVYTGSVTGTTGGTSHIIQATINGSAVASTGSVQVNSALSVPSISVNAGSSAVFTISLNAASAFPVAFSYVTQDGTALQGVQYTATSGTGTIPAGQTSTSVTVSTLNDGNGYESKNFNLNLTGITNASATTASGIATVNTPLADSVRDFGSIEGDNQWFYGQYVSPDSFGYSTLAWNGVMWLGTDVAGTPLITQTTQHPGCGTNTFDGLPVVRRWVNPSYTGTLTLVGHVAKANTGCGNGTSNTVVVNGVTQFTKTLAFNDSVGVPYSITNVPTTPGDTFDIATDFIGDCTCDETAFSMQIFYTPQ